MKKIPTLIEKYSAVISYLFFGVLTTAVNYLVYFPCCNWLHLSPVLSNILAWAVSVIFAYLTNKPFVFHNHDWSHQTIIPEFSKFVSGRFFSGALETGLIFVSVELLAQNENITKLLTSVLVVIANYLISKLLVFRQK